MSSEPSVRPGTGVARSESPTFVDTDAVLLGMQTVVGRKWHPVIVSHLLEEALGFSDLKGRIDGISSKVLSESLADLEDAGLVCRDLLSDQPVRVEYSLTDRGAAMEPLVAEMVAWGSEHLPAARREPEGR